MTYLNTADTATLMGVEERTVRAHIKSGRLPAIRDGRDWYVHSADARAFEHRPAGRPTEAERLRRVLVDARMAARAAERTAADHG